MVQTPRQLSVCESHRDEQLWTQAAHP